MMQGSNTATKAYRAGPGWLALCLLPITFALPGCAADKHLNPSFPLTIKQAKDELQIMAFEPAALMRPVVVLGGWGDVLGLPPAHLARQLRRATGDDRIIAIGFGGCTTFDSCRARLLARLDEAYPCDDPAWTTEVDVVGFSMGGIVARFAAATAPGIESDPQANVSGPARRLRIARLYTICTPHRGASLARALPAGRLAWDMRPNSSFLGSLDQQLASADYPIIPYARIPDTVVGVANAAPPGEHAWWLHAQPFSRAHVDAYKDPRIIADIARRLRGETPYTTEPAAPLPE